MLPLATLLLTSVSVRCTEGPINAQPHAIYYECNSMKSGETCTPGCGAGWTVSGSFQLVCEEGKGYDASAAKCIPESCSKGPEGPVPPHASLDKCTAMVSGDTCTPDCAAGWTSSGSFELLCNGGTYDASFAHCVPNTCSWGPEKKELHASYTACNAKSSGEMCTPSCQPGFKASGSFELLCEPGKGYDASSVQCIAEACSNGPMHAQPGANYDKCTAMVSGDMCNPTCGSGYTASGGFQLLCVGGSYDAGHVHCIPDECSWGPMKEDPHASYDTCSSKSSGATCSPTCEAGWTPSGSFELLCLPGKGYDASAVQCIPEPCTKGPVYPQPHAVYDKCNAMVSGQTCTPHCEPGWTRGFVSFELQCVAGQYKASSVKCEPQQCSWGPHNGDIHASYETCVSKVSGDVCTPTCAGGYTASGSFTLLCLPEKGFDASAVTCLPNKCLNGPVHAQPHAHYDTCNGKLSGEACKPTCDAGYTPSGEFDLFCLDEGYDASSVTCIPDTCSKGPLHPQPHANYDECSAKKSGETCKPTCATSWRVSGSFTLVCSTEEGFDASSVTCIANACLKGPVNPQPHAHYDKCNLGESGDTCKPTCDAGWTVSGSGEFELKCLEDGYNASSVTCIPDTCSKGPLHPQPHVSYESYEECNGKKSGETCKPICPKHWRATGSFELLCLGGQYDASSVECVQDYLFALSLDINGMYFPGIVVLVVILLVSGCVIGCIVRRCIFGAPPSTDRDLEEGYGSIPKIVSPARSRSGSRGGPGYMYETASARLRRENSMTRLGRGDASTGSQASPQRKGSAKKMFR